MLGTCTCKTFTLTPVCGCSWGGSFILVSWLVVRLRKYTRGTCHGNVRACCSTCMLRPALQRSTIACRLVPLDPCTSPVQYAQHAHGCCLRPLFAPPWLLPPPRRPFDRQPYYVFVSAIHVRGTTTEHRLFTLPSLHHTWHYPLLHGCRPERMYAAIASHS